MSDLPPLATVLEEREWFRAALAEAEAEIAELRGLLAETVPDPEYRRMQDIEIERLREALKKAQGGVTDYAKQYVALRAENARLREALTSARTMLVAFGGDPRGSANGDEIQAAILGLIDAALAAGPRQ